MSELQARDYREDAGRAEGWLASILPFHEVSNTIPASSVLCDTKKLTLFDWVNHERKQMGDEKPLPKIIAAGTWEFKEVTKRWGEDKKEPYYLEIDQPIKDTDRILLTARSAYDGSSPDLGQEPWGRGPLYVPFVGNVTKDTENGGFEIIIYDIQGGEPGHKPAKIRVDWIIVRP